MKGESFRERRLRQAGIIRIPATIEFKKAFEDRTLGFLEASWPVNPDYFLEAIKQYGMDCYLQGLVDGNSEEVMKNPHAVALGKKGGAAGRGASKTRSRAHYVKIAKASVKARRLKAYQAKISGLG